jgi:hypothetical protein
MAVKRAGDLEVGDRFRVSYINLSRLADHTEITHTIVAIEESKAGRNGIRRLRVYYDNGRGGKESMTYQENEEVEIP